MLCVAWSGPDVLRPRVAAELLCSCYDPTAGGKALVSGPISSGCAGAGVADTGSLAEYLHGKSGGGVGVTGRKTAIVK